MNDRHHLRRSLILRYEDLVSEPDQTLEVLWSFLGVDGFDSEEQKTLRPAVNDAYYEQWRAKQTAGLMGMAYLSGIQALYGRRVSRLGYSLRLPCRARD